MRSTGRNMFEKTNKILVKPKLNLAFAVIFLNIDRLKKDFTLAYCILFRVQVSQAYKITGRTKVSYVFIFSFVDTPLSLTRKSVLSAAIDLFPAISLA